MLRCRLPGHRLRFAADGAELRWDCARGCGAGGARYYAGAEDESRDGLGRQALPFGLLPLRIAGRMLGRRR
jgi:hypothetical protein